jgi:PAS domain S-box-containing protein
VIGLPLLMLMMGAVYSLSHLSVATEWMDHTNDVRISIEQLRSTAIDSETGMRGYLIAGEARFLEPYQRAVSRWRAQFERVRALTTDNPTQQERLHHLEELLRQSFAVLAKQRSSFDDGQRDGALTAIMNEGKRLMDPARTLLDDMEHEEARLDVIRQGMTLRRWQLTMVLFVGGAFASLVVLGAALIQRRGADARQQRAEDVTRAIEGERHLLQAILNGMEDAITLQDGAGKLIFANPSAARLLGFPTPEALLGATPTDIRQRFEALDENGAPFALAHLPVRTGPAADAKAATVLVRSRAGDAVERWSNIRAYPLVDAQGDGVQAITVFRDVTSERRDEERRLLLLRVTDELNSALDYAQTLAAVARLVVPTLADGCAFDVVEGEERRRLAAHGALASGERSSVALPMVVGGRTVGEMSLVLGTSPRPYQERDLAFARSVADRAALAVDNGRLFREVEAAGEKLAEQLVQETKRRFEAESTARFAEMFVGMLGHDLRNPLNAVGMTARLLQRKGNGDPKALGRIVASVDRMSNMVAQLLDLTRSRLAGGIEIERKPLQLGAIITETLDELRLVHPDRAIHWKLHGDDRALGDQVRLAQVVSNLVGNAVEHGDVTRPVTVTLSVSGDSLVLVVHNAGTIPPALLPVIFDPFRRTTARGELAKGLGLGLFISQQIVQAHGGDIEVRSSVEEGTTFTVNLPRSTAQKFQLADGNLVT